MPAGLVDKPYNLDLVNWLLNQSFVGEQSYDTALGGDAGNNGLGEYLGAFTYGDVQKAIWTLIENSTSDNGIGTWSPDRANELVAAAIANGENYSPGCGDTVAVILQPVDGSGNTNHQITIAQITLAEIPNVCGCILNVATGDSNQTGPESDWVCTPVVYTPGISILKSTVDGSAEGDEAGSGYGGGVGAGPQHGTRRQRPDRRLRRPFRRHHRVGPGGPQQQALPELRLRLGECGGGHRHLDRP